MGSPDSGGVKYFQACGHAWTAARSVHALLLSREAYGALPTCRADREEAGRGQPSDPPGRGRFSRRWSSPRSRWRRVPSFTPHRTERPRQISAVINTLEPVITRYYALKPQEAPPAERLARPSDDPSHTEPVTFSTNGSAPVGVLQCPELRPTLFIDCVVAVGSTLAPR